MVVRAARFCNKKSSNQRDLCGLPTALVDPVLDVTQNWPAVDLDSSAVRATPDGLLRRAGSSD